MFTKEILRRKKYDFYPMVNKYIKFYGKKNCKVMMFEDLVRSPKFIENIVKFTGEKKALNIDTKETSTIKFIQ